MFLQHFHHGIMVMTRLLEARQVKGSTNDHFVTLHWVVESALNAVGYPFVELGPHKEYTHAQRSTKKTYCQWLRNQMG